jgi:hypothetical protein
MARLIPSFMDDRTPTGERDVFNMLAAGPDDWVAMHSLDLAPWNRGLRTEIDFVVIVPDSGLLCVEVKSHGTISFENDHWAPPDIRRSPFKQAADGRYAFYRRLRDLAPEFKSLPVVHCCIFPRAIFDLRPNLSVQPHELMDCRRFAEFRSGGDFCADLRARLRRSVAADGNLRPLTDRLSCNEIERIVECCLPVQKRRPDAREQIVRREQEAESVLRAQQKPVLELAERNQRIIVSGGAGTGKTLIAMEVARRAAERGRRVALLCFNQLVGEWMKRRMAQVAAALPNLLAGRAIQVMAEMSGLGIPAQPTSAFWDTELPDRLEERLTDPEFRADAVFDTLVLDEAQDLLARPRVWRCLEQFLAGGFEAGTYSMFGDFEGQSLTRPGSVSQSLGDLDLSARPARWRLSENCRNYRIVGDTAVRLAGFAESVYADYMRTGGSVHNYDIAFFDSERAQLEQLGQWLRDFKSEGYRPSEITILSFGSTDDCAAKHLSGSGFRLRPAWQAGEGTGYASINAFKGMENKVVILTDLVLGEPEFHRHLFYTGMTRATESVRVLCAEASKETLVAWLSGKVRT